MKRLFIFSMIIFLSSCATSYHRKSFTGGYSEIRIREDVFKVLFKGNSRTSMERAVDFALLRSAVLTLRSGYKYFVITKGKHYVKEFYQVYYDGITANSQLVQKPRVYFDIKCYHSKPKGHSYNANYLAESIKEKYRLKNQ